LARWRVGVCLLVSCLAACGDGLGPTTDFVASWSRWERRGPDSYVYEFQRSCFCGSEATQAVRITVTNDAVTAVARVEDGQQVPPDQVNQFFRVTIDSLFRIVAVALEDAHTVAAQYDAFWGHPTHVSIDYIQNAIDDEVAYSAALTSPAP
jgi:hypothetical protein